MGSKYFRAIFIMAKGKGLVSNIMTISKSFMKGSLKIMLIMAGELLMTIKGSFQKDKNLDGENINLLIKIMRDSHRFFMRDSG